MSEPFSQCSLSQGRAQAFQGYTTNPIRFVVHPGILHLMIDQGSHGYFCSPASLMNENFSGHTYLLKLGEKKQLKNELYSYLQNCGTYSKAGPREEDLIYHFGIVVCIHGECDSGRKNSLSR